MVLKIDPRFPIVWRSPRSIQVGVQPPILIVEDVTVTEERLLSALQAGASRGALPVLAAGSTPGQIDGLLAELDPVLIHEPAALPAATVLIVGGGPTVERLARSLAECSLRVCIAADVGETADISCDFAVAVGYFVLAPELHSMWLRRDIPHLSVVISDSEARVGPLVRPGDGPCLYCLEKHASDRDPAWPAIATQLLSRRPVPEGPLVAAELAALSARMAIGALAGRTGTGTSVHLRLASGEITRRAWRAHPDCACNGVELSAAPVRRENDWPRGSSRGGHPRKPRTAAAVSARA